MPRLLAALLFLFSFALLLFGRESSQTRFPEFGIAALIALLLAAATFALERAGYRATVFAFLFLFLGLIERRPLWLAVVLSGGFALASFYLINNVLRVPLPLSRWGW